MVEQALLALVEFGMGDWDGTYMRSMFTNFSPAKVSPASSASAARPQQPASQPSIGAPLNCDCLRLVSANPVTR